MDKTAFYYWLSQHNTLKNYVKKLDTTYLKKYKLPEYYLGIEDEEAQIAMQKFQQSFDNANLQASQQIQTGLHHSEKFVLDMDLYNTFGGINVLQKYAKDIKPFLPYPITFMQIRNKKFGTTNQQLIWEQDGYFFFASSVFNKKTNKLHNDPNTYAFKFSNYETWHDLLKKPDAWSRSQEKYVFLPDTKDMKCHDDIFRFTTMEYKKEPSNDFSRMIFRLFHSLFFLNFVLTYKNITKETLHNGKSKDTPLYAKTYKNSDIYNAPNYEHKTLKIDLHDDDHYNRETNSKDYKPKKWHMVRGHLRKLANGDMTFVRHHSRGNAELGTVTKDYKAEVRYGR